MAVDANSVCGQARFCGFEIGVDFVAPPAVKQISKPKKGVARVKESLLADTNESKLTASAAGLL
jgi:hypothetical protein